MPTLTITITEKHIEVPGDPTRCLAGFEIIFDLAYAEGESEDHARLPHLIPVIDAALKYTMGVALGPPMLTGEGKLEDMQEAAIAKVTENPFPAELESMIFPD
jgi:hypothetical protein